MRYLSALVMSLSLASCSIVSSTPVLNEVLASKGDTRPFDTPLPVNTAHKKLAIGYSTTVGVKEDGTVWSWGSDTYGSLGNGREPTQQGIPTPIAGMTDFIEVAGTGNHFLALHKDGTVWSWGDNRYGQLGYATTKNYSAVPQQVVGLKDIISVAASLGHSLALDKQGAVWSFGSNNNMQLGFAPKDNMVHVVPTKVWANSEAVKVIANGGKSAVLTNKGEIYYWGADLFLQSHMTMVLPKKYDFPYSVSDVAIGMAIYVLTTDGFVWGQSGNNYVGELGQGDFQKYEQPVKVKKIGRIKSITATLSSGTALDEKGQIWQWGGSVRFPSSRLFVRNLEPLPVLIDRFSNAVSVNGNSANAVFLDNGEVYFWGVGRSGSRGTGKIREYGQSSRRDWSVPEKSLWTWK